MQVSPDSIRSLIRNKVRDMGRAGRRILAGAREKWSSFSARGKRTLSRIREKWSSFSARGKRTFSRIREKWSSFSARENRTLSRIPEKWTAFRPGKKGTGKPARTAAVLLCAAAVCAAAILGGKALASRGTRDPGSGELQAEQTGEEDGTASSGRGGEPLTAEEKEPGQDQLQEEAGLTGPAFKEFQGMLSAARLPLDSLREQAEELLCQEYRELLDQGKGDLFTASSPEQGELFQKVRRERKEELEQDPNLILVNKWHMLPEEYEADPVDLDNGQRIGSVCSEQLKKMLSDCAQAGGTPIVCSGYRPHWYQENLFDAQVNRWLYAGYGQEDAEAFAATAVAVPGTSEHELGLAADIYSTEDMDLDESQIYTFTQQWLMENCWKYGFILRYPMDKSGITGIIFEPWHYRYVGKEHAKKICDAEICLEEYLDEVEHGD